MRKLLEEGVIVIAMRDNVGYRTLACMGRPFWRELPPQHCGEDVLAQQRVMARFGGCAILPSGAYHMELPTMVTARAIDAPYVLPLADPPAESVAGPPRAGRHADEVAVAPAMSSRDIDDQASGAEG